MSVIQDIRHTLHSIADRKHHGAENGGKVLMEEHLQQLKRIDRFALERTFLANERTMLAYSRTGLSCFLVGVALVKFFPGDYLVYLGGAGLLILGSLMFATGLWRFSKNRRKIEAESRFD